MRLFGPDFSGKKMKILTVTYHFSAAFFDCTLTYWGPPFELTIFSFNPLKNQFQTWAIYYSSTSNEGSSLCDFKYLIVHFIFFINFDIQFDPLTFDPFFLGSMFDTNHPYLSLSLIFSPLFPPFIPQKIIFIHFYYFTLLFK